MIISHKHKFIFIKTAKTAGTSLEIALSSICGDEDIITPLNEDEEEVRKKIIGRGAQNYDVPFRRYFIKDLAKLILRLKSPIIYGHTSARKIKRIVGKEIWNSYYKFCFERNPFDKIISLYYWRSWKLGLKVSLSEFIEKKLFTPVHGYELYTIKGKVVVDNIYKYEELPVALKQISEKLNLTEDLYMPKYRAKSQFRKDNRDYKEILNEQDVFFVKKYFAREIELLNYGY